MHRICSLQQKTDSKINKKHFIPAFTSNWLSAYWGHPEASFQSKRPSEGCIVEVFYVLGRKQGGCGGGLQRWFPGTRRSRRDPGVKFLWDLKELDGRGRGRAGSFGSMGVFVAAAHLHACHSPCRPVLAALLSHPSVQLAVPSRTPSSPTHKHTWHLSWPGVQILISFCFFLVFPINLLWLFHCFI